MLLITFMSLTMEYGIVSKFRICHTFPFGSVIILGLMLENRYRGENMWIEICNASDSSAW
jgi:hypothetical protein